MGPPAVEGFVAVQGPCDGRCCFCDRGAGGLLDRTRPLAADAALIAAVDGSRGVSRLTFGGDEPLAEPRILDAVRRARGSDVREICIMTSGLRLADENVAPALAEAGVDSVVVPLYGPDEATHDAVVGVSGVFERLRLGVERARGARLRVRVHSLVLRSNLARLRETDEVARAWTDAGLEQAGHVLPRGPDLEEHRAVAPRYADVIRTLEGSGIPLGRFPLCIARRSLPRAQGSTPGENPSDVRVFPPPCRDCTSSGRCPGVPEAFVAIHGFEDLLPER